MVHISVDIKEIKVDIPVQIGLGCEYTGSYVFYRSLLLPSRLMRGIRPFQTSGSFRSLFIGPNGQHESRFSRRPYQPNTGSGPFRPFFTDLWTGQRLFAQAHAWFSLITTTQTKFQKDSARNALPTASQSLIPWHSWQKEDGRQKVKYSVVMVDN